MEGWSVLIITDMDTVKKYKKLKKETYTRKCYKYNKIKHITKYYRTRQKIKNRSIQKELDEENNDKQEGFVRGLE